MNSQEGDLLVIATSTATLAKIEQVRRFNRFYTRQIGLLHDGLLNSPFSLTEVRIMYELANSDRSTAWDLCAALGLDAGYVSRILSKFALRGLISKTPSDVDRRQSHLKLTSKGRKLFASLNARSNSEISTMLSELSDTQQSRLTEAMHTIEEVLNPGNVFQVQYIIRQHQPGDMGWIIYRHGALYSAEYGWGPRFEALVAEIAAAFLQNYQPDKERCWIAERQGEIVGSVMLVKLTDTTAKLRLLLVEPNARGLGIGKRLVAECIRFARHAGYSKITLWTNSVLIAARRIYEQAGFRLVLEEPNNEFGKELIAETWEIDL